MSENQDFYINTTSELIDLIASEVINNRLLSMRLVEAVTREIKVMVEEGIKNILPFEENNINWKKLSTDLGIKGSTDPFLVIRKILNDVVNEVIERQELATRLTSDNLFYLPEKTTNTNKKLQVLMD